MAKWNEKSIEVAKEAFKAENLGSTISGLAGGITGIVDAGMKNAQIADTSGIHSSIDDTANTEFAYNDYDSLLAGYNPNALQSGNYSQKDIRGVTGGEMAMNTISGTLSGAAAGAQVGGPWGAVAGAAVGLGSGLAGIFTGNAKARREANLLNAEAENANRQYMQNFALNASNIGQDMFNSAALNLAAEGGQLDTYDQSKVNAKNFKMKHKKSRYKGFGNYYAYGGQMMSGDWSNGVVTINEGDTHERNPLGGVLMGVDQQGIPNLVEEGEVIFNDYVYSNRLKPTTKQLEEMHLDPKLEGLTYAEAAKKIQEESELRPLDNISKNTLVDGLAKLTVMQEETRMKKERAKMLRTLRHTAIQEPQESQGIQGEVPMEGGLPMENQGAQMPEAQFAEHTPRAYKQIQGMMGEESLGEEYSNGGLVRRFDGGTPGEVVVSRGSNSGIAPVFGGGQTYNSLSAYNAAKIREEEDRIDKLLTLYYQRNSGLSEAERQQIAAQIDFVLNPNTTTTEKYYDLDALGEQVLKNSVTSYGNGTYPYFDGYDVGTYPEFGHLDKDTSGFITAEEIEGSKEYTDFTNYILNNSTDEKVLNYLRKLDESIKGNDVPKLFGEDGNLVSNWKDLYNSRRSDAKFGTYHSIPQLLSREVTTPKTFNSYLVNDDGTRTQLTPEDVNNYMFSSRDTDGSYLYKGVPTATTGETKPDAANTELSQYPKANFLQYAPAIGGALTTLASLFQKPDYTNADRVAASRRNVRRISSRPISGYLGYNPYDTNLQQTKLANQTAGAMRNVLNTSSGNRAAAMTDLLAYNARGTEQSGDIYRQALEFNDAQRLKVGAHNADINKFNSQQGLQADSANQSTDLRLLDNVLQEARMRDAEYAGLQTARSANLSNLFNNMGEIGKDIYTSAQEKFLIDRGYVPGIGNVTAKGGSIRRRKRRRC